MIDATTPIVNSKVCWHLAIHTTLVFYRVWVNVEICTKNWEMVTVFVSQTYPPWIELSCNTCMPFYFRLKTWPLVTLNVLSHVFLLRLMMGRRIFRHILNQSEDKETLTCRLAFPALNHFDLIWDADEPIIWLAHLRVSFCDTSMKIIVTDDESKKFVWRKQCKNKNVGRTSATYKLPSRVNFSVGVNQT